MAGRFRISKHWKTAALVFQSLEIAAAAQPPAAGGWAALDAYQETISRERFESLLGEVYAPAGAASNYVVLRDDRAEVLTAPGDAGPPAFTLRFGTNPPPRAFKTPADLAGNPPEAPLRGLRVALDPGHIGGVWAQAEGRRFYHLRSDWPVQEAALTRVVARLLRARLEALGAAVVETRTNLEPATLTRPWDFAAEADAATREDSRWAGLPPEFREAARLDQARKRSELAFYRTWELRARARLVNEGLRPDVTLCLHFNALDTENDHDLIEANSLLFYIHGAYGAGELAEEAQRQAMLGKLLEGAHDVELPLAEAIAAAMRTASADALGEGLAAPVQARNLAANRLFRGPVVYLEPYYMNNRTVYARIQAGDYDGARELAGRNFRSLFREYADSVAAGLRAFYHSEMK